MDSIAGGSGDTPWLTLIGLGDDGPAGLAPRARERLAAAEAVFGGRRHLELLPEGAGQERIPWPSPLEEAVPWLRARRGRPVAVLASGDPQWYGIGATLGRHFAPEEMEVVPAPSAFSLAAARMGWPLQSTRCLSVHARPLEAVRPWLHDGARLLVLGHDGATPAELAQLLTRAGFGPSTVTALEHLGGSAERRREAPAEAWPEPEVAALNTVAIDCRAGPGARPVAAVAGRPEADFEHDGAISKREVRAALLAHLAPGRGERLWDVGAGSGSVAVEWCLADPDNTAIAVEPRADRAERIRANAAALGAPAVACIQGRAPEALADLPPPDAVFIGGGLTRTGLLAACLEALPPGGRLVASSVTVEGDAILAGALAEHGGELVRIAVDRAAPLGGLTGWEPLRPVTLWSLRRP
ncbi:MAG: precorrin-6y C5,15-methyltransferase (decarboxylating) subunit CbiE [Thiohalospira sp.]